MATLSLFPDRTSGRTADGFCSSIFICRSFAFHLLSVPLQVMSWAAVASLPWWPFCFVCLSYPWGLSSVDTYPIGCLDVYLQIVVAMADQMSDRCHVFFPENSPASLGALIFPLQR